MSSRSGATTRWALASFLFTLLGCDGGGLPTGWHETPEGEGPRIVWDLYTGTLPEIPLPNDVATWPDPDSPTGIRLNASTFVPTHLESHTRSLFDELDGWGTFAPISVSFEEDIDLDDLLARQGGSDHFHESDFAAHAVYLVDLETGLPVPLDLNSGNFPYVVTHTDQYFDADPRATESNVLFETVEEDDDGDGVLDPGEDTDFDGVLDHPSTIDRGPATPEGDGMAWFYERETRTLIVRPLLPLRQRHEYAVVLTNRLVGERTGAPVRSPFPYVHHLRQTGPLAVLPERLAAHPELYGSVASSGWNEIAFAWTFTTQSVTDDLDVIREGLYGRGAMARLADEFSVDSVPLEMQSGRGCADPGPRIHVAPGDAMRSALAEVADLAFGLSPEATARLLESYATLSHVVTVVFESPYFFADPENEDLEDAFEIDWQTGEARVTREALTMTIYVPTEGGDRTQPFSPTLYVHGHGSNAAEVLTYGGLVLQHGNALVTINAHGHGLDLDRGTRGAIEGLFAAECIEGAADALTLGRARDLDGNGSLDSGADFWTAYIFHTRDSVRQTIVDEMMAVRVLRSWDGTRVAGAATIPNGDRDPWDFDGDYDRDGAADLAGDFDGNGVPDVGGTEVPYAMAGGSLGGIITGLMSGVEPAISTFVPVVGGGGLADVAIRTENGSVLRAMLLRVMGPLVVTTPVGPDDDTACDDGDVSVRVLAPLLTDDVRAEIACLPAADVAADDVLLVRNLRSGEVGCAGATNGMAGIFRVPIASDEGDPWVIEHYRHARDRIRFGACEFEGDAPAPDRTIETWEAGQSVRCSSCATFGETSWEEGDPLVAPAAGFGRRRQTPDFRRLVMLAQIGLERGDPVNYVRRVFLDPVTAPDVPVRPRNILVTHTDGDPNVCIATGFTMARAAGVLPFLPSDAPEHLFEFRAPATFLAARPGFASPNDVLLGFHAIEGLARLERHPVAGGGERFLADVDDLSDGRLFFASDGESQLDPSMGGLAPVTVGPPLRWSRRSRPMADPTDDVWTYAAGEPTSGVVMPYVEPRGIHGFSVIFEDSLGFDMAAYMFNMLGRYSASDGTDVPYLSDPTGHGCLEDSSCDYIRR